MYLIEEIEKLKGNIKVFVDMDGVIAEYDIGKPYGFDKKRPLTTSINKLEEISKLDNVVINILSVCKTKEQIKEKNDWLDINAPFFQKDNRFILAKENFDKMSAKELKLNYLKQICEEDNDVIIFIDDDNELIKYVRSNIDSLIIFQDSSLVD